jgi:hypothetical protein
VRAFLFVLVFIAGVDIAAADEPDPGSGTAHITFVKRAEIGFPAGGEGIPAVVRPELIRVAKQLKDDLARAAATIEVEAYAADPGSRLLALQRVVDVRLALVEAGVPAEKIDVRVTRTPGVPDMVTIYLHREAP